jgi:hypothetical protein
MHADQHKQLMPSSVLSKSCNMLLQLTDDSIGHACGRQTNDRGGSSSCRLHGPGVPVLVLLVCGLVTCESILAGLVNLMATAQQCSTTQ